MTRVPWCVVVIEYKFGPGAAGNLPRTSVCVFGSEAEWKVWHEAHPIVRGERRQHYMGDPRSYSGALITDYEYAPNAVYAAESLL